MSDVSLPQRHRRFVATITQSFTEKFVLIYVIRVSVVTKS